MTKLEVLAIPAYFATMGAEYAHHRARNNRGITLPGDYERRDTLTSLTMGAISLAVPLVAPKLLAPFTPGKGRYGKALIAGTLGVAAATTVADVVVRNADAAEATERAAGGPTPDEAPAVRIGREKRRRRARLARKVARVGGVASVAAGGAAITTAWGHFTRPGAMWKRKVLPDLGTGVAAWAVALVGWDALYYWNHRIWHESRFMWANHVAHHSSERYNLSTALRQAVTDPFLFLVPYSTLSLLGVRPELVASSRSLNLLYQYWVHTDAIERLGPVEEFANTPSHHRVHHGVNPQYIDRNHGGILIVWDLLFGTFEREDETVGRPRVRRHVPRRRRFDDVERPTLVRAAGPGLGVRPSPQRCRPRPRCCRSACGGASQADRRTRVGHHRQLNRLETSASNGSLTSSGSTCRFTPPALSCRRQRLPPRTRFAPFPCDGGDLLDRRGSAHGRSPRPDR